MKTSIVTLTVPAASTVETQIKQLPGEMALTAIFLGLFQLHDGSRVEYSGYFINERIVETSLMCTCDYQPWACQSCDFDGWVGQRITDREAVIRKRFRKNHSSDEDDEADQMGPDEQLKTSDYDPDNAWLERDPETTQTFKRKQQVIDMI